MINKQNNPAAWARLMYELEDAKEHLSNLINEIETDADYDEVNLRIDLGHIYSHLNRAWHGRNKSEFFSEQEWIEGAKFPSDLDLI